MLLVTVGAEERFHQVDFPRDEVSALYRLTDNFTPAYAYKFEWQFDQLTATSVIVEMRAKGATDWKVLSLMKEAATSKASVTVLVDPRPEVQRVNAGFLLRCGWGFENRAKVGLASGWGSRDVILPGPIGADLQWKCSPDNPEEMFSLSTTLNDYRIRIEKTAK
jgi:hypothetical protein